MRNLRQLVRNARFAADATCGSLMAINNGQLGKPAAEAVKRQIS
jgi:hypothetical protein